MSVTLENRGFKSFFYKNSTGPIKTHLNNSLDEWVRSHPG